MSVPPLPLIDPHFHLWDVNSFPNPNLGDIAEELPVYSLQKYEEDCGIGFAGSVHVEAIVGRKDEEAVTSPSLSSAAAGGEEEEEDTGKPGIITPLDETRMVLQQIGAEGLRNIKLVVYVKLSAMPEAQAVLDAHRHVAGSRLAGVRMILNYSEDDPTLTWPAVERGDYLTGGVPAFREGFALLAKHDLSFDLQVNWFQLQDAAKFLKDFPTVPVIVNHLGCLKLGTGTAEEDKKRVAVWSEGMRALAALPNVYVKLSMLEYLRKEWQEEQGKKSGAAAGAAGAGAAGAGAAGAGAAGTEEVEKKEEIAVKEQENAYDVVKARVREVIGWFGAERCMFASNFPVTKQVAKTSLESLVMAQHSMVADLPEEDRRALFHDTAKKVYKLK